MAARLRWVILSAQPAQWCSGSCWTKWSAAGRKPASSRSASAPAWAPRRYWNGFNFVVMVGLDPQIKSEDMPGHPGFLKPEFAAPGWPLKGGHDIGATNDQHHFLFRRRRRHRNPHHRPARQIHECDRAGVVDEFEAAIERVVADATVKGIIVTSGKS